ncbi:hypothetical protein [Hymenobacter volaticus]|uniref:Uncharacterized protein n=1 Tax=Hymenobacter volaticus TaxID=2932254 RepID=A0ABY4G9Q3_9BACT|nr:hypothetical protein [Hymenobacter volaticus]UOQ67633.1 hypothetical protein MUN86_07150 [Hymenobacter volaticus]
MPRRKNNWIFRSMLFLVLGLIPMATWAQKGRATTSSPALPAPPGTVRVAENLFVDQAEVANIHWLEYLHFIRRDSALAFYNSQLPDSTVWQPVPTAEQKQAPQAYFRAATYVVSSGHGH